MGVPGPTPPTRAAFHRRRGRLTQLWRALPWLIGLLAGVLPHALRAQEIGDAAAGRHLAATWCSSCHLIDRTSRSGASTGVPSFTAVARDTSVTPPVLRVFLQTPHASMPDLHLTRVEIDDLIAYIASLRGP